MKSAFYLIPCLLTFVMCNKRFEVLSLELVHAESFMLSHSDIIKHTIKRRQASF